MESQNIDKQVLEPELDIEAVDLGDLDTLEEDIVPCTGCGCVCILSN